MYWFLSQISRSRALQVAKQLPEDQKIRKWVVLSREDRYVPRVLRVSCRHSSEYDVSLFSEQCRTSISVEHNSRRLWSVFRNRHWRNIQENFLWDVQDTSKLRCLFPAFQPFVILLFSDTPVNQTMTNMWRKMSLAPALHIFRIGNYQKRQWVEIIQS